MPNDNHDELGRFAAGGGSGGHAGHAADVPRYPAAAATAPTTASTTRVTERTVGREVQFRDRLTGATALLVPDRGSGGGKLVTGVETPIQAAGKGGANAVMRQVTSHLDRTGTAARLVAVAIDDRSNTEGLQRLYSRHGFSGNPINMTRAPRGK